MPGACLCAGVGPGQLYHIQTDGPHNPEHGLRFDPHARLIDPYAKALAGDFLPAADGIIRPPKCVVVNDEFEWQNDRHLRRTLAETVIYELHVRGFTRGTSSNVAHPGTYLGLIEKIPYLQSLGVTAVELMPVFEFPVNDCFGQPAQPIDYWGYDPLAFFAPHRGYAADGTPARRFASSRKWCWHCIEPGSKSFWTWSSTIRRKATRKGRR